MPTVIKRRVVIPIKAVPTPAQDLPASPPRRVLAPVRKAIDPERKAEVVQKMVALRDEEAYQSDYVRIMRKYKDRIRNPMTAIRSRCVECCCGQPGEVAKCTCEHTCSLWPFRLGTNPYNKRVRERLTGDTEGTSDDQEQDEDEPAED